MSVTSSWKLSISFSLSALGTKISYETEPAWPSGLGRWSCSPEIPACFKPSTLPLAEFVLDRLEFKYSVALCI